MKKSLLLATMLVFLVSLCGTNKTYAVSANVSRKV